MTVYSEEYPALPTDANGKKIKEDDDKKKVEAAKNLWGNKSRFKADFPEDIIELDKISNRLKLVSPNLI